MLSHYELRAQLPLEDKLHPQLQLRGKQGQVPPCQSSHREGRASLGPHWFPAGTCAHLVPVSLLYLRQRELWAQRVSPQAWCLLDISTAQESMLQAPPVTAGGMGQASRQERDMKEAGLSLTQGLV